MTPLEVVQHQIVRHTDRNPTGPEVVVDMIGASLEVLGDDWGDVAGGLLRSLDPHDPAGFGVRNALALHEIGTMVLSEDDGFARIERMGAMSLLGALALTFDQRLHDSGAPELHSRAYRSQAASFVARNILADIAGRRPRAEIRDYQQLARAFLSYDKVESAEDLATELELYGLLEAVKNPAVEQEPDQESHEEVSEEAAEIVHGSSIGEPYDLNPYSLEGAVPKVLADMHWLSGTVSTVAARDVMHDGKTVALLADLTPYNRTLEKAMGQLLKSRIGANFWDRMAQELVRFTLRGTSRRVPGDERLPTFYLKNVARSETILRAYYTTLGRTEDGLPVFALIAAARTKSTQVDILRTIKLHYASMSEK